jgi:hypothetical protein
MGNTTMFVEDFDLAPWEQRLASLIHAKAGITPGDVLKDARNPESPLHDRFDWNDSQAAEKWRLTQAGSLIRQLKVKVVDLKSEEERTINYVTSVVTNDGERKYVPTEKVISDTDLRGQMLGDARRDMLVFQRKYAILNELSSVFDAMNRI